MQQQTGSEPPNRCPPELLVKTYITHTHTVVHLSTGGRHQVKMQQTGSEPPNRNPPELLVIPHTSIHYSAIDANTTYMFFSHIRTRYFSEGSVQQHPPPYSFRRRVPPELLVMHIPHTSIHYSATDDNTSYTSIHYSAIDANTTYMFFSHIRTRYVSEGSVQQTSTTI